VDDKFITKLTEVAKKELDGEGKQAMDQYGFTTNHPHHITFALKA
jgi:hypothetical protein